MFGVFHRRFVVHDNSLVATDRKQVYNALNENFARGFISNFFRGIVRHKRLFPVNFVAFYLAEKFTIHNLLQNVFIEQFRLSFRKITLRKLPYKFVIGTFFIKVSVLQKLMVCRSDLVSFRVRIVRKSKNNLSVFRRRNA